MPSVQENLHYWGDRYSWMERGEEWSEAWGGADSQWYGSLLPRIHAFVPATTILEIAPGFGRWTHYLQAYCTRLVGVDLAERCVEACRQRFHTLSHVEFHVNDGTSLGMVPDGSVDFVFSCDSLVHVEADVMAAYLRQLAAKLKPDGVGFIHHSNLGAYLEHPSGTLPSSIENRGWRAQTMSAAAFREQCESARLLCVGQEVVTWWGNVLSDCFSMFTLPRSHWAREHRIVSNEHFTEEAASLARMAPLYTTRSFGGSYANGSAGSVMHLVDWAKRSSRRNGVLGAVLTSAKGLPLMRRCYRWWKHKQLGRQEHY